MFGAFFKGAASSVRSPLWIFILVTLVGRTSLAAQPAPQDLIDRFLKQNQLKAISYLENNLANIKQALECLENTHVCEENILYSKIFGEDVGLEFTQDELVQFIKERHREYRMMIGIHSYPAIKAGMALGRGKMATSPIRGIRSVIFDTNTEAGQQEWDTITAMAESEFEALEHHNVFLQEAGLTQGRVGPSSIRKMMEYQVLSYTQKFPFLLHMNQPEATLKSMVSAFTKLKDAYVESLTHIATLQEDDLYELFGFVATIDDALQEFSKSDQKAIEEHFVYLEESNTIWKQILDVITSPKFLGLVACFTAAIVIPPVGVVCSAIGLTLTTIGVTKLAGQANRLADFMATGQYDRDVYTKYLVSMVISAGLYVVILKGSIPGFITGVRTVRTKSKDLVQKIRLSGTGAFGTTREFLKGEYDVLKRYFIYYLKEFSSEGAADVAMTNMGEMGLRTILPSVRRAFLMSLNKASLRDPHVLLYSDVLRVAEAGI